jgi:hypothetical protein
MHTAIWIIPFPFLYFSYFVRNEPMEDWRKLHNEELHISVLFVFEMGRTLAYMGKQENAHNILVGKPNGRIT